MRAALQDLARDSDLGSARVVAVVLAAAGTRTIGANSINVPHKF
jgi:hypothetical protein